MVNDMRAKESAIYMANSWGVEAALGPDAHAAFKRTMLDVEKMIEDCVRKCGATGSIEEWAIASLQLSVASLSRELEKLPFSDYVRIAMELSMYLLGEAMEEGEAREKFLKLCRNNADQMKAPENKMKATMLAALYGVICSVCTLVGANEGDKPTPESLARFVEENSVTLEGE